MASNQRIEELEEENQLLKAELERVMTPPFRGATVMEVGKKTYRVSVDGGGVYEVARALTNPELDKKVKPKTRIAVTPQLAVVEVSEFDDIGGGFAIVEEVGKGRLRIEQKGEQRYVLNGLDEVKAGDEVLLDSSGAFAIQRIAKRKTKYTLEKVPDISWNQVGGLESVVRKINDEVEMPFLHKETYARYGRNPAKGVLLYGPPGCGKTLIAKAIANNLAKITNSGDGHFINVKGPEILDKFVGNSEANIRRIYATAREVSNGAPTVIFIDEAESVLRTRGTGISSDVHDSIVPQFLSEMDGLEGNHNIITVLATNREDIIDPAVLRPGRVDRKVAIPRPGKDGAYEIFGIYLKNKPLEGIFDGRGRKKLAECAVSKLYDEKPFYHVSQRNGEVVGSFQYRHVVSGAMIENIVSRACGYAIKREIETGKKKGLNEEDMQRAVNEELEELSGLSHLFAPCDYETVFKEKGKQMYEMAKHGYLHLERANGQIQTTERRHE